MKKSFVSTFVVAAVLGTACAHAANAPAAVDSKEYKVLLDPSRFASNPSSAASSLLGDLSVRLSQLAFDKTVSGGFSVDKRDNVAYYDTAGTCVVRGNNYAVRTRSGGDSDIQFKFSHPDEELSAATLVTGTGKNKSTKLETDVGPASLVYSHSTKQDPATTGAPTTVADLITQFSGASTLSSYKTQALVPVNGLDIVQQEYTGPVSDLGQSDAEFTLTLWYVGGSSAPALAELSYKVKADSSAYFTTPVLTRSQTLLKAMSTLDGWMLSPSTTKTAWVYNYRSAAYPNGFCSGT
ncbi:hypothetical protein EC912_102221 [Luteibacter rhizovicinus]|uniref:Lipoprotein n=1 Tax=Luteibacter rhizovicinus TaxID=242606 RepID=A0A4R3YTU3_9GAMM|nr:hypothetical protein [Luteibacter rhizovicinus]TCV95876.1 hypothetical protein EC912_102221 [Luteibacter rhizovicinus]